MNVYTMIAAFVFGYGLYKVFCGVFELPTRNEYQTIMAAGKRKKEKISRIDQVVFFLSHYVMQFISVNPYRRKKLVNRLKTLGIRDTPEMVYAKAITRGLIYIFGGLVFWMITPLLTILFFFLGFFMFFKEIQMTDKMMITKRAKIEKSLANFACTLEQELKYRMDVVAILEDYRDAYPGALSDELEITLSDMKSSNYENALNRLDVRIGSPRLSNVIRGLTAVLRGDQNMNHFHALAEKYRTFEANALDSEIEKRQAKIKRYAFLLVGWFLVAILYPLIYDFLKTLPALF